MLFHASMPPAENCTTREAFLAYVKLLRNVVRFFIVTEMWDKESDRISRNQVIIYQGNERTTQRLMFPRQRPNIKIKLQLPVMIDQPHQLKFYSRLKKSGFDLEVSQCG